MSQLIFVDESVDDWNCCFGSILATGEQVAAIESRMAHLRARVTREHGILQLKEFHGQDIFQRSGPWKHMTPEYTFELFQSIIGIAIECDVCAIFKGTRREQFVRRHPYMDIRTTTFENLLERIHEYLARSGEFGLITSDRQDAFVEKIRTDFVSARLFGTSGY